MWEVVFFVAGVLFIFRKREGVWWLVPVWFLIGIIPAATARETPHALRIETILPTVQIITAYGLVQVFKNIKALDLRFKTYDLGKFPYVLSLTFLVLIGFINFIYFHHEYYAQYPHEYSAEWQYGYKDSIKYVTSVEKNYDYIQVTNGLGRPYIYYLFYMKTDPAYFRKSAVVNRDAFGFVKVEKFGKYIFPDNFDYSMSRNKKILYIGTPYNLPKNAKILKKFKLLDDNDVLIAYTF
jgi:hypothetical protein